MHAVPLRFSSYIPVLILKSQRLRFSETNNFSQINKFFVKSVLGSFIKFCFIASVFNIVAVLMFVLTGNVLRKVIWRS